MIDLSSIIDQLEQHRASIDNALEVLRGLGTSQPEQPAKRKKYRVSSEGRQRQIDAIRQYWAKKKGKKTGRKKASKRATKKATKRSFDAL